MKVLLFVLFVPIATACIPGTTTNTASALSLEKTALLLRSKGDHLNASYYLEAALETASTEKLTMYKMLVEEQILAGRMLAATETLRQMEAKYHNNEVIKKLRETLETHIGLRADETTEVPL